MGRLPGFSTCFFPVGPQSGSHAPDWSQDAGLARKINSHRTNVHAQRNRRPRHLARTPGFREIWLIRSQRLSDLEAASTARAYEVLGQWMRCASIRVWRPNSELMLYARGRVTGHKLTQLKRAPPVFLATQFRCAISVPLYVKKRSCWTMAKVLPEAHPT